MKATGIVRRIDDLGRVVIPKEIRRTMRIREGEPLEIFTDRSGEIILQKYSPIGEISDYAKEYVESLSKVTDHIVCITDRDQIIAVSGGHKELLQKQLHKELEKALNTRETFVANRSSQKFCKITEGTDIAWETISPIISEGDVFGSVCILETDKDKEMGDFERKLALSASTFLGRQMEP